MRKRRKKRTRYREEIDREKGNEGDWLFCLARYHGLTVYICFPQLPLGPDVVHMSKLKERHGQVPGAKGSQFSHMIGKLVASTT